MESATIRHKMSCMYLPSVLEVANWAGQVGFVIGQNKCLGTGRNGLGLNETEFVQLRYFMFFFI